MDPASARNLAAHMSRAAEVVHRQATEMTGALRSVRWVGVDAQRFRNQWQGSALPNLNAAITKLRTEGKRLMQEAEQQEAASRPSPTVASGQLGGGDASDPRHAVDRLIANGVLPTSFQGLSSEEASARLRADPQLAVRLQRFGQEHPGALADAFPALSGNRDQVRAAFEAMSPEERKWVALMYPTAVGGLPGAPFSERVIANRVLVIAALEHAEAEADLARAVGVTVQELKDRIEVYQRLLNENRQLVYFDPRGDGAWAELIGSIDENTRSAGMYVPGMGTDMNGSGNVHRSAKSFVDESRGSLALVAWAGGDLPDDVPQAMTAGYSQRLGPALAGFSHDLRQEINHSAAPKNMPLTALGHSYGGAVVGIAEQHGLDANRILHVNSAGAGHGIHDPSQYHNANGNVPRYVLTAPGDPIVPFSGKELPGPLGHGADVRHLEDVIRLETGRYPDSTFHRGGILEHDDHEPLDQREGKIIESHPGQRDGFQTHGGVLTKYSGAWWNMYHVMTGGSVKLDGPDHKFGPHFEGGRPVLTRETDDRRPTIEIP